ncbi:organic solvent tolerance protein OstA [Cyanobium sp. NIES-981]|uniref:organic solvent tolerance protein OstA n=1 Tax=Cyanobium sp. NIES-981 TaxID=1851505 RepID=UPI000B355696|nr:organic solvent tolerance protein OstA [Cyanobium sp. NIES-981]
MALSAPLVAAAVLGLCVSGLAAPGVHAQVGAGSPAAAPAPASAPARAPVTGVVTIESDLQRADNSTGILTASGNVRIVYEDQGVVATARQAQYFSREGRLVLSGEVDVVQGDGNTIRAERLVYLVNGERLLAEPAPGQQVLTLYRFRTAPAPAPSAQP